MNLLFPEHEVRQLDSDVKSLCQRAADRPAFLKG